MIIIIITRMSINTYIISSKKLFLPVKQSLREAQLLAEQRGAALYFSFSFFFFFCPKTPINL